MCKMSDKEIKKMKQDNSTAKQLWYAKRKHCIEECKKCKTDDILKKIYWELRKKAK